MELLRQIPLFNALDEATFAKLSDMARLKRYRAGEILFYEGEMPDALSILVKGNLKLYKTSDEHKEIVMHHFKPVSFIAEMALLHRIPYPATALFESDGEVILIDYERFETVFLSDPKLSRLLVLSLSEKVRALEMMIASNMVLDARQRVLKLIDESPDQFQNKRHYELAALLNMTPETFSRMLKKLLKEGVITKEGTGYTRVD